MLPAHTPTRRSALRSRALRIALAVVLASLVASTLQLSQDRASAVVLDPTTDLPSDAPTEDPPPDTVPPAPEHPNILLITTDDQTVADLKYMPRTRELLGEQGATFTDAISSYPLCCPARATILTGQLSHNHGVKTNKEPYGGWASLRRQTEVVEKTIGAWLQNAGYHTMFTGKFLNGYGGPNDVDPPAGWDNWYATSGGTYNFYDFRVNENGTPRQYHNAYQTDVFGDYTRAHIDESVKQQKPFFVWESNLAPHDACYPNPGGKCQWGPAMPAKEDRDKFSRLGLPVTKDESFNERVVSEKPAHVRALRAWGSVKEARSTRKHRARVRSLQAVDRSVEDTVEHLRTLGVLDDTLIIFTSDNGYMLGQHRWQGKILPYEPSLRIPMLMRWTNGDIPAGVKRSQTSALVDLPATIAEAANVEAMLVQDGRSLLAIARGDAGARGYGAMSIESGQQGWDTSDHRWFYRGVRTRRYTYVRYPRSSEVELYDRRRDPSQVNNVAYRPAYHRTRAALARKLTALQNCIGDECLSVDGSVPGPLPEPHLTRELTVHPDELGSIGRSSQVVTVTARNWRTGTGMATAWQRRGRTWTVRRGPFPVTLGSDGLIPAGLRRDGTGESPAGTFRPAFALGRLADPGTGLSYRRFDKDDYWVMDRREPNTYNVYQERRSPKAQWRMNAAEHWWSNRGHYPHALVLDYNLPQRVRYAKAGGQWQASRPADVRRGSFVLHTGDRLARHGWTSMSRTHIRWLLRWMRPQTRDTRFVLGTPSYLRGRL